MGSDLPKLDAHRVAASEYDELPELTDDMVARATFKHGDRPQSAEPKPLTDEDGEVRELTAEDMTRFRPSAAVLPPELARILVEGEVRSSAPAKCGTDDAEVRR